MSEDRSHEAAREHDRVSESDQDATHVSKEDADRLKKDSAEAAGVELPGEDPEDNPDREGEERFDAG